MAKSNQLFVLKTKGLQETLAGVSHLKNGQRSALMGGINDTLKSARAYASKLIRDKVNLKKKDLDPYIGIFHAQKQRLSGSLNVKPGRRISLKYFGARQTKAGVTYKIDKKGAKKTLNKGFMGPKLGVMAVKLKGHPFVRVKDKRKPVAMAVGVSAWGAFAVNEYPARTKEYAQEQLEKNVARRVNFLLLKAAGKI